MLTFAGPETEKCQQQKVSSVTCHRKELRESSGEIKVSTGSVIEIQTARCARRERARDLLRKFIDYHWNQQN